MLVLLAGRNAGDAAEGVGAAGFSRGPPACPIFGAACEACGVGRRRRKAATAPVASTATMSAAANFCDELLYSMRVVQFPCDEH
ncbi:TPA: hypothetical protein ACG4O4_004422, partial [Stenotrophomonas maltophilia]